MLHKKEPPVFVYRK